MPPPPPQPAPRRAPARAWLVVIVTAFAVLVLIGQKNASEDRRKPLGGPTGVFAEHPDYGFVLSSGFPGGDPVTQQGFVGSRAWPAPRVDGQVRIMVLGDSNSVRIGALDWPEALEARLRGVFSSRDIWMQNFAVPGYSSWNALQVAKGEATAFDPDIVILNIGTNDPYPAGASDAESHGRPYAVEGGLLPRVAPDAMAANMQAIATIAEALPRQPYFVHTIAHWPRESDHGVAALTDATVETCRASARDAITFPSERFAVVDFEAITLATGKRASYLMPNDTIHLNDAGHRLLADAYFDLLRPVIEAVP